MTVGIGKSGIEIAASGVTIDLNGFQIASLGGVSGIVVTNTAVESITIRNGRIIALTTGVAMSSTPDVTLQDLRIELCSGMGANLGDRARIIGCTFSDNQGNGVLCGESSNVTQSTASNNQSGIVVGSGGLVSECVARGNTDSGIASGNSGRVIHCSSSHNFRGVDAFRATVEKCSASFNSSVGINVVSGRVTECTVAFNTAEGIYCPGGSVIENNDVHDNGGAGIFTNASFCRIDGNYCRDNAIGIHVNGISNLVIRNTCSSNTVNWNIAARNHCLVVQAVDGVAFTGNSGGTSPGSTNPNANYTY